MRIFRIIINIFYIFILTVFTQVGGLVYLCSLGVSPYLNKKFKNRWIRSSLKGTLFVILYLFTTFLIVPLIAKPLGRVPLPLFEKNHIKPLTSWTAILNRNYVKPELREITFKAANELNEKYPGSTVNYLDACFPFINGFRLFPHLSHMDGKKLDLSFCYDDKNGTPSNTAPSFFGYGICEEPLPGEVNTADECDRQGAWQYSILKKIFPQDNKVNFIFNPGRTADLINAFAHQEGIGMIFLEPHLEIRLKLAEPKIRFHGCHVVRHDDHFHVQLK